MRSFWKNNLSFVLVAVITSTAHSFSARPTYHKSRTTTHLSGVVRNHNNEPGDTSQDERSSGISSSSFFSGRRDFVTAAATAGFVLSGGGLLLPPPAEAAATSQLPICVIGANGRTGTQCVQACLDRSIPVRATSRSGIFDNDNNNKNNNLLTSMMCDVTIPKTIVNAVLKTRAVIFCASASKQGGTPSQVDNVGLVNVAEACLLANIPHLVIVSSGGVSKPNSPVYQFLNLFGRIMEEKIKGEDAVRKLYRDGTEKMMYTVIRPGGLTDEPAVGVVGLELNQGDTKSGRISRADVASLCVESILYPQYTRDATFECYNANTGKNLASVGMSNILKQTSSTDEFVTGRECRGDTWEQLFSGLERDDEVIQLQRDDEMMQFQQTDSRFI